MNREFGSIPSYGGVYRKGEKCKEEFVYTKNIHRTKMLWMFQL